MLVVELTLCNLACENWGHVVWLGDFPRDVVQFVFTLVEEGAWVKNVILLWTLSTVQCNELKSCVGEVWWTDSCHSRIVSHKE